MAKVVTKGQIGKEDLNYGTGTFARTKSDGTSQNIQNIPLDSTGLDNDNLIPVTSGNDVGSTTSRWDGFFNTLRWYAAVAFAGIFSHSNTADRTYTFPDATTTIVGTDTTQTLTSKTINSPTIDNPTFTNYAEGSYCLQAFVTTSFSLADAGTLYFTTNSAAQTDILIVTRLPIPRSGNIVRWDLGIAVTGVLGSTETVNHWIRLNNTSDNLNIQTTWDAANKNVSTTGSLAVVAGDYIHVKVTAPTWATNPTNVLLSATIFIRP